MDVAITEIILVVFLATIAVFGSSYCFSSVVATITDVVAAVLSLVATATTAAVNGLFGLSLFPVYVAVTMVVVAAAANHKVGGIKTAHYFVKSYFTVLYI